MRALFQRAAKQAPCIIFMDELDTLGKQRSLRLGVFLVLLVVKGWGRAGGAGRVAHMQSGSILTYNSFNNATTQAGRTTRWSRR